MNLESSKWVVLAALAGCAGVEGPAAADRAQASPTCAT